MVGTLRRIVDDGRRTSWHRCDCGPFRFPVWAIGESFQLRTCSSCGVAWLRKRPVVDLGPPPGGAGRGVCTRRGRR